MKARIESFRIKLQPYYLLIANFGYLSLLQLFNLALPLLTYPYLIRVLGTEQYGMVVYSQAIVSYLVVLVNFGFNITATKDISVHRDDPKKITEIASSVYLIKGVLFLCSCLLMSAFLAFSAELAEYKALFYLTLWMCLYEFVFPLWYFQGTEKMKYITVLTLVSRLFFLTFIFVLIHGNDDYLLVPAINGIGSMLSCVVSLLIIRRHGVKFQWQPFNILRGYLRRTYVMALSYGTNIFKTNFSIIVVKHLFSLTEVVYFDLATKIINLGITFLDLISQAVFPRMSRLRDTGFLKKILAIALIASLVMVAGIQVLAPTLVYLLGGEDMDTAIDLTRLLAFNLPVYIIGALFGRNCLLVNGFDRPILGSMAYSALVYLILVFIYINLFNKHELFVFAYIYLFSFLFETIYRYQAIRSRKLI
ncbi:oligosaccharide flippase family protein [Dyadobacter psychrophilus]|nr:oligosaccharide flippase family protein [Dyadobacter psychrophilus]